MRVQDVMTQAVESIQSKASIRKAARIMGDADIGALPVVSDEKLVGIVTDRDIAVRAVAAGLSNDGPVDDVMSEDVTTCSPNDDLEDVLHIMSAQQVRRLPVCNERGRLVGMISLGDAARQDPNKREIGEALGDICEPSRLHCQVPAFA